MHAGPGAFSGLIMRQASRHAVSAGRGDVLTAARRTALPSVILTALVALAGASHAAVPARAVQGKYCSALLPPGWSIAAENPAGSAFGADVSRDDGAAVASYYLVGVPAQMRSSATYQRWYRDPHTAALALLSKWGTQPIRCSQPGSPAPDLAMMQCQTAQYLGLALYQAFPLSDGGYVLVMRTVGMVGSLWATDAEIISAVARSIRCNVPFTPRAIDWTSGPKGSDRRSAKRDSQYSRWLGMEHYHDPRTGENYWVSPSTDYRQNGPQGGGYYVDRPGEPPRKLEPGRSD